MLTMLSALVLISSTEILTWSGKAIDTHGFKVFLTGISTWKYYGRWISDSIHPLGAGLTEKAVLLGTAHPTAEFLVLRVMI